MPRIQVTGGGSDSDASGGTMLQTLMAQLLSERGDALLAEGDPAPAGRRRPREQVDASTAQA